MQINEMREKIRNTIKTFKIGLTEKNKLLAQKGRDIKRENNYVYSIQLQSIEEKNRNICSAIKSQEKERLDRKKRSEVKYFNIYNIIIRLTES
jgi:hypothetical protein